VGFPIFILNLSFLQLKPKVNEAFRVVLTSRIKLRRTVAFDALFVGFPVERGIIIYIALDIAIIECVAANGMGIQLSALKPR
jgi:hypothetical protein